MYIRYNGVNHLLFRSILWFDSFEKIASYDHLKWNKNILQDFYETRYKFDRSAAVSLAEEFTFEENDFSGKFLLFRLTHHWVRGLEHWLTRPQTGHMCNFQNQQVTPLISRDATSAFASQWLRWYLPFDCNLPRDHPCTCKCNNFLLIKIVWKCQSMLQLRQKIFLLLRKHAEIFHGL